MLTTVILFFVAFGMALGGMAFYLGGAVLLASGLILTSAIIGALASISNRRSVTG